MNQQLPKALDLSMSSNFNFNPDDSDQFEGDFHSGYQPTYQNKQNKLIEVHQKQANISDDFYVTKIQIFNPLLPQSFQEQRNLQGSLQFIQQTDCNSSGKKLLRKQQPVQRIFFNQIKREQQNEETTNEQFKDTKIVQRQNPQQLHKSNEEQYHSNENTDKFVKNLLKRQSNLNLSRNSVSLIEKQNRNFDIPQETQ